MSRAGEDLNDKLARQHTLDARNRASEGWRQEQGQHNGGADRGFPYPESTPPTVPPTPNGGSSRKRKVNLVTPAAGSSSAHHAQDPPQSRALDGRAVKQEDYLDDLDQEVNWGARSAAGRGADEAAEELERIMDDGRGSGSAQPQSQNGYATPPVLVESVPAPTPAKKRKRAVKEKDPNAPPTTARGKKAAAAAAAAAALAAEAEMEGSQGGLHAEDAATEASFSMDRVNGGPSFGVSADGVFMDQSMTVAAASSSSTKKVKKAANTEPVVLARRLIQLEEMQRKVWVGIARRDIPKVSIPLSLTQSISVNEFPGICELSRSTGLSLVAMHTKSRIIRSSHL